MLPSPETPLYHHSLTALEDWLGTSGFERHPEELSRWELQRDPWTACLELHSDGLVVHWTTAAGTTTRQFSYGLSRADLEAALQAGP